jgi:hypothetical protein
MSRNSYSNVLIQKAVVIISTVITMLEVKINYLTYFTNRVLFSFLGWGETESTWYVGH